MTRRKKFLIGFAVLAVTFVGLVLIFIVAMTLRFHRIEARCLDASKPELSVASCTDLINRGVFFHGTDYVARAVSVLNIKTLDRKQRYELAIKDLDSALAIAPKNSRAYWAALTNRGLLFEKQDRYPEAIPNLNEAIVSAGNIPNQDLAVTYRYRGLAYFETNRYEEALKDFDHAISLNPQDASSYNSRSLVYGAKGQPDLALRDNDQAIALLPMSNLSNQEKGLLYQMRGRFHLELHNDVSAKEDLEQADKFNQLVTGDCCSQVEPKKVQ